MAACLCDPLQSSFRSERRNAGWVDIGWYWVAVMLLLFADTFHAHGAHAQKHSPCQHCRFLSSLSSPSDPVQGRNTAKAVAAASAVNPALPVCWWTKVSTKVSLCLTTFHIVSCYAWNCLNTLLGFARFLFCIVEFVCFKGPCPWWPFAQRGLAVAMVTRLL